MFQESAYTGEQGMIADFASQLSRKFDELYFIQSTKKQEYPEEFWQELSEGGYLGISVAEAHGGVGLGARDMGVLVYNLAKNGLGSLQLLNQLLCADVLARYASEELQSEMLPGLLSGEKWCWAHQENATGQNLFDVATRASEDGKKYVLNGSKCYVTGASSATFMIVTARAADKGDNSSASGLSLFVVDMKSAGVSVSTPHINVRVTDNREEMAATGDVFNTVTLENVEVPAGNLLGEAGEAGRLLEAIASRQMLMQSLLCLGWGDRLLDKAVDYANDRVIFQDPVSSYQAVQHPLVLAKTKVEMAKLFADRAASAVDGEVSDEEMLSYCSVAKYHAAEAAYAACDITMQAHGGAGFDRDTGVVTLWPLILVTRLVPLNSRVILQRYAESVLGLPQSSGEPCRQQHELVFEERTELEKSMITDIRAAMQEAQAGGGGMAGLGNLMAQLMGGNLSQYKDMVMSSMGGALPVKLDFFRQYAVHGNENPAEGAGIPSFLVNSHPVKFGLSAMAMAAVATGKDGQARIMSEFLPEMMKGHLFCYCITEPGAGTNTHKIKTVAKDMGDHYLLNGQKTYISAADTAYFMAVVARVETEGQQEAVGTFLMKQDTEGVSMTELDIAALGDPQFTVYFDNVKLPKDSLVGVKSGGDGSSGKGISEGVFYTLNLERIMVALGAMQVGRESLEKALKKASEKDAFGHLPGASSVLKEEFARLHLQLELTNLALKNATVAYDAKENPKQVGMYANMAKYLTSMFADEAGQLALEVYGIEGMDKDGDDIGGLCKIGRVLRTVPINNEMVLNFLGENLMGMPKSYRV